MCLFVVTAFAGRLIKKETLGAGSGGVDNIVQVPVQGGVFRYPLFQSMRTLDPAKAIFSTDVMLVQQLYDGLTAFDEHLNVVPALAKFWEISPDGKTYTFELREGARFHNGRKVTAEDCVFSFERLLIRGLNDHNCKLASAESGAESISASRARRDTSKDRSHRRSEFRITFVTPFVPALSVSSACTPRKILPNGGVSGPGRQLLSMPPSAPARSSSQRWSEPAEDAACSDGGRGLSGIRLEANLQRFEGRPHSRYALVFRCDL